MASKRIEERVRAHGCIRCGNIKCIANQPITFKTNTTIKQPCNTMDNIVRKSMKGNTIVYEGYMEKQYAVDFTLNASERARLKK